ncbi:MAG: ATP-binding cassette domain-containing protein [Sedimentibacter sp.]|uniref:sulfate/molybdate ABC transporter ATP-binding protein n=1 Tax=Sedimentibacter sp. TaxID=1960295 RepID=UPI003158129D
MILSVDIKKRYKGFSLDVKFTTNGEYLGLLGASGSGKSMTLKCIAGIETPDEGKIMLNDKVLFDSDKKINLKPQERNIGYMFQSYALFPNMTVEENIGAGLKGTKMERQQKINEMLKIFHMDGLEKKYPGQLSGGQQQRTALARCIAYEPDVLLLDEPFSALDSHLKEQLLTDVLELLKFYKGKVIMVTHSRDEAYRFCENLVIIDKGMSVLWGDTKDIFKHPRLLSAARLMGCKNISKCEMLSPTSISLLDFGITIETENEAAKKYGYAGISSNGFQITDNKAEKNTIECKVIEIIEEEFDYTIIAENKVCSNSKLYFKVIKEKWDNREENNNLYLKVKEDCLFMLE